jgi:multiple sugar transport system substrate-binding protein
MEVHAECVWPIVSESAGHIPSSIERFSKLHSKEGEMKLRRLLILAVLLASPLLSLHAKAQDKVIEIEYWQYFFQARKDAMDMLIQQFEAQNPDIHVVHNADIAYADFRTEIATAAAAGTGPDVVTLYYGWIPAFVDAGYLVPLPEPFTADYVNENFVPMVAQSAEFEGQLWAVPTAVRALGLFYNKDLLAAAGFDHPPTTLDEFKQMAIAATVYDGEPSLDNIVTEGFAVEMEGQAHVWFREALVRQFGGVPYSDDNKQVMWNSPEGCAAFEWLTDFETNLMTGTSQGIGGTADAATAFVNGLAALHIDGSFRLAAARGNPDLNFGVAELPVGPNGEKDNYGSYWTHGITRRAAADPARMEAATRFLEFITSAEAGTLWVNQVGELPAQVSAINDPALLADPIVGPFIAGLPYAHATFFVDETQQRQVMIDAFDLVRYSGVSPCDALNEQAAVEQDLLDEFWAAH